MKRIALIVLAVAIALTPFQFLGLRLNSSGSHVPAGLYRAVANDDKELAVGDTVLFDLRELHKLYPERRCTKLYFEGLVKTIAALPGAIVERSGDIVLIDGAAYPHTAFRPPYDDGEDPCKVSYPHVVEDGHVWLMADTREAYDSRYFGDVPVGIIQEKVKLLWLW